MKSVFLSLITILAFSAGSAVAIAAPSCDFDITGTWEGGLTATRSDAL